MSEVSEDDKFGNFPRKQDEALLAASFEPTEGGLWVKDGVLYGREAALQYAFREKKRQGEDLAASDN